MLYDKVRRFIDQEEINKLHKPIDLTKGPQARASTQAVMNSDDIIVARNHCKYQAMWGKCTKGRHCPHEHVNYPRVREAHKQNRRPLPGQGRRPNNERFRPNKIRGWNVRRDSPRSRSTGGNSYLSRDSSGGSVNSLGSRTGRGPRRGHSSERRYAPERPRSSERGRSPQRSASRNQARSTTQTDGTSFSRAPPSRSRTPSSAGFRSPTPSASSKHSSSSGGSYSPRGTTKNCKEWLKTGKCENRES